MDLALIKQRTIDREKIKYQEYDIYKKVSQAMTYDNNVFEQNIDRVTDPQFSPLVPGDIMRKRLEAEQKNKAEVIVKDKSDPYSTNLPEVQKFTSRFVLHQKTLQKINPNSNIGLQQKLDQLKKQRQGDASSFLVTEESSLASPLPIVDK